MPSIYDLKPAFQNILRPITVWLADIGVTANQVTVAAMLLSLAAGAVVFFQPGKHQALLLIPVVLFIRMALNAIDGMLAREFSMKSHLGAILNELGDVISDAALYLPLALVPGFSADLVVVVVILAIVSEMTGVVAVQTGAQRQYKGPMGKSDRAFVFGLMALLTGLEVPPAPWVPAVLWLTVLLLLVTIVNRARCALRESGQ